MKKRILAYILVGLLIVSFTIPQASAGTLSSNASLPVENIDALWNFAFVGFTYIEPPGKWERTWDSNFGVIDCEISIEVLNRIDGDTHLEWKAEIVMTISRDNPFQTFSVDWHNEEWPYYAEWDVDSEDIEDNRAFGQGNQPAAIQGDIWELEIELTTWWMEDEHVNGPHYIYNIGYIQVI